MTLAEIMEKITQLSDADRAILRRELEQTLATHDVEDATPEMRAEIAQEKAASGDERGLPIEDVVGQAKPSTPDPQS